MRNFFVALLLVTTPGFFASCKKDHQPPGDASLQGSWELLTRTGGFAAIRVDYPLGNNNLYFFDKDTYSEHAGGQTIRSGHYKLVNDTSYTYQRRATRIVFDGVVSPDFLITVTPTRMILTSDANDGYTFEYRKIMYD